MHNQGQGKDWYKYKAAAGDHMLKQAIQYLKGQDKSIVHHLIRKVSSIANASSSKLVDSIVLKLLLININDFKLGFDHVSNRIVDERENLKFSLANVKLHRVFLKMILALLVALMLSELLLLLMFSKRSDIDLGTEYLRFNDLYKPVLLVLMLLVVMFKKLQDNLVANLIVVLLFLFTGIDCLLIAINTFSPPKSSAAVLWLAINITSRLISSALPVNFLLAAVLLVINDLVRMIGLLFFTSPITNAIKNPYYLTILGSYFAYILFLKISLKKKVLP